MRRKISESDVIRWLYENRLGRILLKHIVIKPWFSKIMCNYYHSPYSKHKLKKYLKQNNIDIEKLPIDTTYHPGRVFNSFNDYFSRKEIRTTKEAPGSFIAIADSFVSAYSVSDSLELSIKGARYSMSELIEGKLNTDFTNGICLVFRLTLQDYHRFVYFDDGRLLKNKKISGTLHTVRDIAQKEKVFAKNKREVSLLSTRHFKNVIQIEIGALLVGEIVNHPINKFSFLEEKGYFSYSGSTIVVILQEGAINLKDEFKEMIDTGMEKQVKIGECIGYDKKIVHI